MALRLITGTLGQTLATDGDALLPRSRAPTGPTYDGTYKIIAKDVLKLTDGDRALAPALSPGQLLADITDTSHSATLTPTGIGDSDYPGEAYLAIGGKEIVGTHRDAVHVSPDALRRCRRRGDVHGQRAVGSADHRHRQRRRSTPAQSQFGGSSLQVQGSDDYIDLGR